MAPPGTGQGYSPTMVACGAGSAIIAWQEGMSPNLDIMAQKVTAGVLSWFGGGMPALVCVAPGDQVFPQACPDSGNGIIIVWEDRRDIVTPSYDIYGEQLDTNGIIQGATPGLGTAICTFGGNQAGPMLANNLINQAIYVWVDGRTFPATNWDLFTLDPIDPTLPVVLSSFTATPTAANYAQINWITQSETNISGFYIHRNTEPELSSALSITELILGTNSSQQVNYSYTDEEVMAGATYYYWLQSVEYGGHMEYYGPATLTLPDNGNIHGTPEIPLQTGIKTIYPNPFNPQATVSFGIQEAGNVNLTIYNIKGEKVKSIYNGYLEKGTYRCLWNGKDEANTNCSSGIYFVRMTSAAGISNKKVVLSK